MSTPSNIPLAGHPDIAEMRARYERIAQAPTTQIIDGLIVLAGLYVALSPWIIGFNATSTLTVSNLVTGLVVVTFGLGFASAYGRTHGVSWVCPLLGAWTIVSLWLIHGTALTVGSILSNVIGGAVVVLLGLGMVATGMPGRLGLRA